MYLIMPHERGNSDSIEMERISFRNKERDKAGAGGEAATNADWY
jgi:hypothetical protein